MKKLEVIFDDIRHGQNVDIYLVILLSIVVLALDLLNIVDPGVISNAILATLALLASSMLSNRRQSFAQKTAVDRLGAQVATLTEKLDRKTRASEVLLADYPDFSTAFAGARSVLILGRSLITTVTVYYPELRHLLDSGGDVKFIISEPREEYVAMMAYRSNTAPNNPEHLLSAIKNGLVRVEQLRAAAKKPEAVQLRLVPYIPPFGLVIVESADDTAKAFVKLMAFRTPRKMPVVVIDKTTDSEWFLYFKEQFEKLWLCGHEVHGDAWAAVHTQDPQENR